MLELHCAHRKTQSIDRRLDSMSERRILVLGSSQHPKEVTSYTWNDIPVNLNVADFDAVVLNLVPFMPRQFGDPTASPPMARPNLPGADSFARLLFSGNREVVVVGVPG